MPAGFNHSAIRDYLEHTWGLGSSRQTAVFLFAITAEPPCRIASIDAAMQYFDTLALQYSTYCGIALSKTPASSARQPSTAPVNPILLDAIRKEQLDVVTKQFKFLADYLKVDPFNNAKIAELEIFPRDSQERLDLWISEFPEEFESGIKPCFSLKKARRYNSWWNSVRQDVICLYYDTENGRIRDDSDDICRKFLHIANRSDESVQTLVRCLVSMAPNSNSSGNRFLPIGKRLVDFLDAATYPSPVFKFMSPMRAPQTIINADGSVEYREVPRIRQGCPVSYIKLLKLGAMVQGLDMRVPYVHIKRRHGCEWKFDPQMTEILFDSFSGSINTGISFTGKNVLITGAGPDSIGGEILQGLLMGGARVIVTTSRPPAATATFYQRLYSESGAQGSELLVLPFNQGSSRDCDALIDHIYTESGLHRDLDAIIPFGAISDNGVEIDGLGARSELGHRLMMVNVLRLLGRIVKNKRQLHMDTRPTQVILPLSPNHGIFGGDGLYSESKLGLEGLLNRFYSESWSDYLTICGAVIGWTRGTNLMNGNDILAQAIESQGVITFSQMEMAFNLLTLMTTPVVQRCESESILADLTGGLQLLTDLKGLMSKARREITLAAENRKAVKDEDAQEKSVLSGRSSLASSSTIEQANRKFRSTLKVGFPQLPDFETALSPLQRLQGMVDPSSTIVIVGFSELGPWGSARTRWEMENQGKFTQEGYVEMAWMMNLIKHFDGEEKGKYYVGWVDAKTGEHVHDHEVAEKYGHQISEHCGVRLIEPDLLGGYDPEQKEFLHEIAIEEDLPEFDATLATADALKLKHGDKVTIRQVGNPDEYRVQIKRGAHIMVPKAIPFDSVVAGQIPTGWDPAKYGISEDVIRQVDPVTLYALCCASEALFSAGIVDSFEIFKYIHVSELGNFIGSAMGGMTKTRQMYKDCYLDKQVQGDVIQETYLNTPAAWINMLILGSAGPIKTPTGTCATGVESLDSGCESILSGKTKMCFVGGVDDFQEEESYGFGAMKATVNTRDEFAKGRTPREMSRPTTESRAGFVESHGCGIQIIASAELALEMGLPIYGVVASSTMAADKIGRSVPAPGQGVLSFARESSDAAMSPLLDMEYRREQIKSSLAEIQRWHDSYLQELRSSGAWTPSSFAGSESSEQVDGASSPNVVPTVKAAVGTRIKAARKLWGNDFRRLNPEISPLRSALAVWGLAIDDIDIASLHGTSTKANDKNEAEVINKQMCHLGRTRGRPILAVCQKSITGHPKGPAASWQLNGCLQALNSGAVPGNRNADNIDEELRHFEHLVFPTRSIHTGNIKAFLLNSFGFGQKGGQIIGVAPKYFLATLGRAAFDDYASKVTNRKRLANRAYIQAVQTNSIFRAKVSPPYQVQDETKVIMDPLARISEEANSNTLQFDGSNLHPSVSSNFQTPPLHVDASQCGSNIFETANATKDWIEQVTSRWSDLPATVGIDVEELKGFSSANRIFIDRNYTHAEQVLASRSADPHSAFAGRWSAKEAVFKSLGVPSKGAGASLKDIEILSGGGIPTVRVCR